MSKDIERGTRNYAYKELQAMLKRRDEDGEPIIPEKHLTPSDLKDALFNEETKV
jgi:hypothetical protein